jgi:putative transposase
VERILVRPKTSIYKEVDAVCFAAKNLYNTAIYRNRQIFFGNHYIGTNNQLEWYTDQAKMLKANSDYLALPAKVSQHVLRLANQAWTGYFAAVKEYNKNPRKFKAKPKPVSYKSQLDDPCLYQGNKEAWA